MNHLLAATLGGGLIAGGIMWSLFAIPDNTKAHLDPSIVTPENLIWTDGFQGNELNRDNWNTDLGEGDSQVPGAKGLHLLNYKYMGYNTEEDIIVSDGSLKLLNQKR